MPDINPNIFFLGTIVLFLLGLIIGSRLSDGWNAREARRWRNMYEKLDKEHQDLLKRLKEKATSGRKPVERRDPSTTFKSY